MVENWIDEICKLSANIPAIGARNMTAYALFGKTNIPEKLEVFPSALTFVEGARMQYSASGVCATIWNGFTEFHLASDMARKKLPEVHLYFGRIRTAFAAHMTLGGRVAYCMLRPEEQNIEGPVSLQWGGEAEHWGLVARWVVKEIESVSVGG